MTQKTRLADIAYDRIKSMILRNSLKAGQFVNESQLQEMLGLGRTPVREAVLRLAGDDLVRIHPYKGIEISTISPKTIHDIFQLRLIMEPSILQSSYEQLDKQILLSFRKKFADYDKPQSSPDITRALEIAQLDNDFHCYLVDAMENRYASQMMDIFVDKLTIIRSAVSNSSRSRLSVSTQEHLQIIDAITQGKIDIACAKLKAHIQTSYEEAMKILVHLY